MSIAQDGNIGKKLSDVALSKMFNQDYVPPPLTYRASSIPYCVRKPILRKNPDWLELPTIEEKEGWHSAHVGTMIHQTLQELIQDEAEVVAIEPEVNLTIPIQINDEKKEVTLTGHIDLFVHDGNRPWVIDIKTFNEAKNKDWSSLQYLPKEDHLTQLAVYQLAMRSGGMLWYYARDTGTEMFYEQELGTAKEIMAQKIIPKLSALALSEITEELPDIPFIHAQKEGNYWECRYCEFQNFCFA